MMPNSRWLPRPGGDATQSARGERRCATSGCGATFLLRSVTGAPHYVNSRQSPVEWQNGRARRFSILDDFANNRGFPGFGSDSVSQLRSCRLATRISGSLYRCSTADSLISRPGAHGSEEIVARGPDVASRLCQQNNGVRVSGAGPAVSGATLGAHGSRARCARCGAHGSRRVLPS